MKKPGLVEFLPFIWNHPAFSDVFCFRDVKVWRIHVNDKIEADSGFIPEMFTPGLYDFKKYIYILYADLVILFIKPEYRK